MAAISMTVSNSLASNAGIIFGATNVATLSSE
jgi:hypothetical protein